MKEFKEFRNEKTKVVNEAVAVGGTVVTPRKLPTDIVKILNERLGDEYTAHYFYRNAANWCKNMNYKNAATFFEAEAISELDHAKGLQDYLVQWNLLPAIPTAPTTQDFVSLVDIINKAYELEYDLFEKYSANQLDLTQQPATFNFIQGYVNIQNDSVAEYSDLLNALNLIDVNNRFDVLYFENEYFG